MTHACPSRDLLAGESGHNCQRAGSYTHFPQPRRRRRTHDLERSAKIRHALPLFMLIYSKDNSVYTQYLTYPNYATHLSHLALGKYHPGRLKDPLTSTGIGVGLPFGSMHTAVVVACRISLPVLWSIMLYPNLIALSPISSTRQVIANTSPYLAGW